jgi:predicted metal-dependent hydrolase
MSRIILLSFPLPLSYNAGVNESLPDLVTWHASDIPYSYCRSLRRTLCITIHPGLSVLVRAPMRAKVEEIREFVLTHARWILRTWQRLESRSAEIPPPPQYESGEVHPYLGHTYPLEVQPGHKASATFRAGHIDITTKGKGTAENVKKLLDRWYRARAEIFFHERLAACHRRMPEDIPLPPLRIRPMKTRWGTFSSRGRITLNLWLITMPVDCLDYVILHELCHYRFRGHGPRFWKLLERILPDCRQRRKELNSRAMW